MNQKEFIELKQRLVKVVMEYEFLQRKGSIIGNSYLLEFYELLEQQKYLESENKYLTEALVMKAEDKPLEEIETYLSKSRTEFAGILNYFYKQYATAKELAKRVEHYDEKDVEILDRVFKDYCNKYHPAVKGNPTENERNLYDVLIHLYRLGNLEGFRTLLEENKNILIPASFTEEQFDTVSEIYEKSIQELTTTMDKQKQSFPFNREDLLKNATNVTQEHIKLRERNYDLREMNKSLQKDFQLHFSYKFEL